ncbi:GMC family oxidoreductase, partial [bacterium]|nr:GMC family oxidoreductase [bacterium]
YDNYRADFALKRLKSLVKGCGALIAIGGTGKRDDLHTAHQVGTARFGDDPAKSVLDRNCRVHGYDNLSVVDGCFMPTSLGVGPALTIIANALRVGDHLIREAL